MKTSSLALSCWRSWDRTMDTVGTGRASQFRLSERQLGWRLPCPRRGRRPSLSGTRFRMNRLQVEVRSEARSRVPCSFFRRQNGPPPPLPPRERPCVSADHGLQPLRVTSMRRAPPSDIDHARHAVAWLEGRAPCSKSRIHHEMRRAPEAQTTAYAFFASS